MRRIEIRLKDDDTPFLNMLFVIEDKDRFVCTNLDGRISVYPKKEYDFRFLDPQEEKPNNLDNVNSRQNEIEHKLDSLENEIGRLKDILDNLYNYVYGDGDEIAKLAKRVEKLENDYPFNFNRTSKLDERVEKLEMAVDFCSITPTLRGDLEHVCQYSKTMDQPYPRKCVVCGKEEHPYPKEKKDYLFDYDGVIAAFRSAVEKDRRHGTGYLKESTFAQELLHTPIVQLPPTFTRNKVEKAIDAALISINMFGVPRLKSSILSELDKVKEGK